MHNLFPLSITLVPLPDQRASFFPRVVTFVPPPHTDRGITVSRNDVFFAYNYGREGAPLFYCLRGGLLTESQP